MTNDQPRRVLYVINDLELGGAQRVLVQQACALDRDAWRPEVASLERLAGGPLATELEQRGVPVHRLRAAHEPSWTAFARLEACVRSTAPAIVHTHLALAGVAGRVAARRAGVPYVVSTLHNLSDWQERRHHPLRVLDRATLPLADQIVAVSDAVRNAMTAACPALAARAITVRNGVDVARFATTPEENRSARQALGFAPGDVVVGAVARLDPRKGLDTLIEAVAQAARLVPAIRLLVVGEGRERERLERQALDRGIASRVRWAGHRGDVRPYLAAMDVFAAPSRSEGLGVAIIEAMAAGVPVLGSDVGGIPEVLAGAEAGLLLPADHAPGWADALAALARDPSTRARMGAAASRHARRFSTHASDAALAALYTGLAGVLPARHAEAA